YGGVGQIQAFAQWKTEAGIRTVQKRIEGAGKDGRVRPGGFGSGPRPEPVELMGDDQGSRRQFRGGACGFGAFRSSPRRAPPGSQNQHRRTESLDGPGQIRDGGAFQVRAAGIGGNQDHLAGSPGVSLALVKKSVESGFAYADSRARIRQGCDQKGGGQGSGKVPEDGGDP